MHTKALLTLVAALTLQAAAPTDPTLPLRYDPAYPSRSATVNCTANLQDCIDSASPGTTILLTPGAIYQPAAGNSFVLRRKNNPAGLWIVIRSSDTTFDVGGAIAPGIRLNGNDPTQTAKLARLQSSSPASSELPIIRTEPGANMYWLQGLEVAPAAGVTQINTLIDLGSSTVYQDEFPQNIVIDRCYVHGLDRGATDSDTKYRTGIRMDGRYQAVMNSHIANFHSANPADSQAIYGFHGMGPLKISNNYLESASENVMFGGGCGDPQIRDRSTGLILEISPSDIVIEQNYFTKRDAWRLQGQGIKNLLEMKNAKRVLVQANKFENSWLGEVGQKDAILLKSVNETGNCTWCGVEHVTFLNNIIKSISGGITILSVDNPSCGLPAGPTRPVGYVKFDNNIFYDLRPAVSTFWPANPYWAGVTWSGTGDFLYIVSSSTDPARQAHDIKLSHTTSEGNNHMIYFVCDGSAPCVNNLSVKDSIFERGAYGVFRSTPSKEGAAELASSVSGVAEWTRNLIVNNSWYTDQARTDSTLQGYYPASCMVSNSVCDSSKQTFVASNWEAVGFTNRTGGNFRLLSTSPYKGQASDGKDVGADQAQIEAAMIPGPVTIAPADPGTSTAPVTWIGPSYGASINGNTLSKVDFCDGCAQGARSSQVLNSDGYVEYTVNANASIRYIGLTNAVSVPNYSAIDYAFKFWGMSAVDARERDAYIGIGAAGSSVVAGDKFRIAVISGVVKFFKNGVLVYTSTHLPVFPLHVEAEVFNLGGAITGVTFGTGSASPAPPAPVGTTVSWTGATPGITINGNVLTKVDICDGCPQGARSTQTLTGDGSVEYTVNANAAIRYIGLSNAPMTPYYYFIDYAFKFWGMSAVDARERDNFINLGAAGLVAEGDRFKIAVEGGVIKYYKNGTLLYTSAKKPVFPLHVETSILNVGGVIKNVTMQ